MSEKIWSTFQMNVNGFNYDAKFSQQAIDNVFLPFLRTITDLHAQLARKAVVYIAAPPATGKTMLAQFLQHLSSQHSQLTPVRALSLDGFHFSNAYMDAHFAVVDGSTIPMKMVKGAPQTFDVDSLFDKIRQVRQDDTDWPLYDRNIHDVVPDALSVVDADIILIEGNYLLLDDHKWTNIRALADYSVFIKADPDILKPRLIERKMRGGKTQGEAELFYNTSDSRNVQLVLNNSAPADETWLLLSDGDFIRQDV